MRKIILALSIALAWFGVARTEPAATPAIVSAEAISAKIAETLTVRMPVAGRYRVSLADPTYAFALPPAAQGRFDIATLNYDATRQAFVANLSFAGATGPLQITGIAGSAYPVIDVPALAHDVALGEMIAAADLTTIEMPAERASATLITSADTVAGQAARRPLRARQPIFAFDLRKPVLIKKGDLVTIVFALPGIELTAAGQALADGGKDDVISVLNARSRRTIEGRVSSAGTVSVQSPTATLAAAQQ